MDGGCVHLAFVNDACVGEDVFYFGDFGFDFALLFFSGVVFGIFAQVAFVTRFGDGGDDAWPFDVFHVIEFVDFLLLTFFGHIDCSHNEWIG